jgi:MoxR-like ATPase
MSSIPLFATIRGKAGDQRVRLRPLFAVGPEAAHERLERAKDALGNLLAALDLSSLLAPGPLSEHSIGVRCDLRDRTEQGRLLVVSWPVGEQRVGMIATWPGWFFVMPERAIDVGIGGLLERRLREDDAPQFASLVAGREAWIDALDVGARRRKPQRPRMAALFAKRPSDGAEELRKVGVDLDAAAASVCIGREAELERLRALFAERRAVVVTGTPGVGKTAVINGLVRTWRRPDGAPVHPAWLIPPAALIAGMTVIGAWEQRLDAILRHMEAQSLILVIDDLPGWQRTGISSANHLDAARVLRTWIERGRLRVLIEADDEVLAAARERDRALCELLEPVRLEPLPPIGARRVLVALARHYEDQGARAATPEMLAAVIDAHRRHLGHLAAPGGPALLLSAMMAEGGAADPLAGLGVPADAGLNRPLQAWDTLRGRLLDQPEALAALGDAIALAAAAAADPERPIMSLFFSGPSGVGKTEAAKALAEAAFGDQAALIRVDCNELVAPGSAARLTGTFAQPDGLLTGPVRRRPFAVILLDEIEKAHHEVHHLLLQLLGDGRLGDGEGRAVRFDRTVVIMTANIMPGGDLGFIPGSAGDLLAALPGHFPPELINRIDRIVAFRPLGGEAMRELARRACQRVCAREGLQRRGILVELDEELVARLARGPFDPALGARELHRAVENLLAAPLAELAAGRNAGRQPTVVRLGPGTPPAVSCVDLEPTGDAPDAGDPLEPGERVAVVGELLATLEWAEAERERLRAGAEAAGVETRALAWAYNLGDEAGVLRRRLRGEAERLTRAEERAAPVEAVRAIARRPANALKKGAPGARGWQPLWQAYCAAENVLDWLRGLPAGEGAPDAVDLGAVAGRIALMRAALAAGDPAGEMAATVAVVVAPGMAREEAWIAVMQACFRTVFGLSGLPALEIVGQKVLYHDAPGRRKPAEAVLLIAGAGARAVAAAVAGTWIHHDRSGGLQYATVGWRVLPPGTAVKDIEKPGPAPGLGPIRRILAADGTVVDPATGWVGRSGEMPEVWGRALLRQIAGGGTAGGGGP